MNFWKRNLPLLRKRKGLLIIITAALLLELMSGIQYFYMHRMMEDELEHRAESELTAKTIQIKSTLNSSEDILDYFLWKIRAHLNNPDSAYVTMQRIVKLSPHIKGCGVGFEPNYYLSKGRLYEVYARHRADGVIEVEQIGGPDHDYTTGKVYREAVAAGKPIWIGPYEDVVGAQEMVITYAIPLYDDHKTLAGVAASDVSLNWLNDTINSHRSYPSSLAILLTEDGKPIISPKENHASKEAIESVVNLINDSTIARQECISGQSIKIHFEVNGREGTVFYANMPGLPRWQVAMVCYDDEVYASLSRLRFLMLLVMSLAFSILLYVVWRYARGEKKLLKKTMEQERIAGELRIASNIQQALLPAAEPTLANIRDVCVEGRLIPAKEVGGDLYNAFVRDGKLFFCIGDVSGKGIPSALLMATIQTLFHNIASRESNPAYIMGQLNDESCRNNRSNMFSTMFIGVLDLPTGHLRYCNAGHEVPLLDGKPLDAKPNLPIGLFADFIYEMQETVMQPGSTLFLYTDGLTEARSARREMFGRERVMQMMHAYYNVTGTQANGGTTDVVRMVEEAISQVRLFAEGAEQSDDLTMLAISYTPTEEESIFDEQLTLKNDLEEVAILNAFVKDVMTRLNISSSLAGKLRLAVEEAVVNVMEYAYMREGTVNIRVTCSKVNDTCSTANCRHLKFVITDTGVPFNPTEVVAADTTLSAEERPIGGLGILLVRELMDSINYERTDGKNILTLTKTIINNQSNYNEDND